MIRIGDHWLADFASCRYLGFELDKEIIAGVPAYPEEVEARLIDLLGRERFVMPTITHVHMSVIPLVAAGGTIFLDARAQDDLRPLPIAKSRCATVKRFRFQDPSTSTTCSPSRRTARRSSSAWTAWTR